MTKNQQPIIDMGAASSQASVEAVEAEGYLAHITKMEIADGVELRFAVGVVAEIKEKRAAVDGQRRRFTDPAQAIVDEANAFFRPALDSLAACEAIIKTKVVDFDAWQAARRDELLIAVGKGKAELAEADACIVPKVPGMSLRRSMRIEVTDARAAIEWCIANKRLELLQLNEKAIKALAKAANGHGLEIPGVTVRTSATVAITVAKVER